MVTSQPDSQPARLALGCAWLEAGEPDKARAILLPLSRSKGCIADAARKAVADAKRMKMLGRSPPQYVRQLFDQFARTYDDNMTQNLNYRAPAILRSLAMLVIAP